MPFRAILVVGLALAATLSACQSESPAAAPCHQFVDAWTAYHERCGVGLADAEERLAGERGCAGLEASSEARWDALASDCAGALADWPCEAPFLPEACEDRLLEEDS